MPQNPPYLPTRDNELASWATNFSTKATAVPVDFGLVAGDAVAIAAVVDPFIAALAIATDPGTRTPVAVADKDAAREGMKAVVMPFATQISQNAAVTDANKTAIGVTVRSLIRTRNSVTAVACDVTPQIVNNHTTEFRAFDPARPDTKSRPLGAIAWCLEIQYSVAAAPLAWLTGIVAVLTKPIHLLDSTTFPAHAASQCRVKWLGASLEGGTANEGPWSVWKDAHIP